jgi:hypothetical protein
MAEYYKKHEEEFYYVDGKKFILSTVHEVRVQKYLNHIEKAERLISESHTLLEKLLSNRIVRFLFKKELDAHKKKLETLKPIISL